VNNIVNRYTIASAGLALIFGGIIDLGLRYTQWNGGRRFEETLLGKALQSPKARPSGGGTGSNGYDEAGAGGRVKSVRVDKTIIRPIPRRRAGRKIGAIVPAG
jgi:hypothetical protein